jgi:hypothetical protein
LILLFKLATPNDYVLLDKIKELIAEVNADTRRSPVQSDGEDSE